MRQMLDYLFFILFTLILVGCNRSTEEPTPTVASLPTNSPISVPLSALPTPSPIAQLPTPLPLPLPTVTSTPTPALVSQWFPLPNLERKTADGSFLRLTPIPAASQTYCAPDSKVFVCYDAFLDMDFRYPAFMGQLTSTVLRRGGYAGYAIEYTFEEAGNGAGGRSLDFSEGRESISTDARGFEGHSAEEICTERSGKGCTVYNSRIFLDVLLPQPEWYCGIMSIPIFPQGSVTIDLPAHTLIKGFTFSFLLLPTESVATFRHQWFGNDACEPETKAALRNAMEQLMLDLLAGTADPEIQQRYDAMFALAASIQSPYLAINP